MQAILGLHALQYGQWQQDMVPIKNMPAIMAATKPQVLLKRGQWVRLKRAPYKGDLGRVLRVNTSDARNTVTLQVVPRIDLTMNKEVESAAVSTSPMANHWFRLPGCPSPPLCDYPPSQLHLGSQAQEDATAAAAPLQCGADPRHVRRGGGSVPRQCQ